MSTVRLRRLTADYTRLKEYTMSHPRLKMLQTDGDPPERYHIEYRVRSLRQVDGVMRIKKSHTVEILLPRNYPRTPPQCRMLTPVFHPNIAPHAICVGDHWSPGESLVSRIGEMLAYQSYNVKSPLNGEAARWVTEHEDELPLDAVSMIVDESRLVRTAPPADNTRPVVEAAPSTETGPTAEAGPPAETSEGRRPKPPALPSSKTQASSATRPAPSRASESRPSSGDAKQTPEKIAAKCPECGRNYRVPMKAAGGKANCTECDTVFQIQSLPEPI